MFHYSMEEHVFYTQGKEKIFCLAVFTLFPITLLRDSLVCDLWPTLYLVIYCTL